MAAMPWLWTGMGYLTEGRLWLDRTLALSEEPTHERAWALATAGYLAIFQGDEAAAKALPEQARALARQLDDGITLAFATHVLATRELLGTNPGAAIPLFRTALRLYAKTDLSPLYPDSLRIELATAHIFLGEVDEAAAVVDDVLERSEANGDRWQLSYALWGRGYVALLKGEVAAAEADLCAALAIKRSFHDTLGLALALEVLAWTTVTKGDYERGAILFGSADTLWQVAGTGLLLAQREQFGKRAREELGDTPFDTALDHGAGLTLEEALALALHERPQPATGARPSAPALTRRQREVAEMVAAGMSNKQIAAKLVISLRTAEGHVESILTKLNFATRTQIANWVHQQSR
jgi:non-specific serine/threonine protein kinase